MKQQLHLIFKAAVAVLLLVLVLGAIPHNNLSAAADASGLDLVSARSRNVTLTVQGAQPATLRSAFDPVFNITAVMPAGSLGLPGEPIVWVITVENKGAASGTNLIITDKLRHELNIDSVDASRGDVAVSEQIVMLTVPELAPGDTVTLYIYTTVKQSPANGLLQNQAALVAGGPEGSVSRIASTEVYVLSGLPPTGYAPSERMPDTTMPPFYIMAMIAGALISMTAMFVYYRGRRV